METVGSDLGQFFDPSPEGFPEFAEARDQISALEFPNLPSLPRRLPATQLNQFPLWSLKESLPVLKETERDREKALRGTETR